MIKDNPSVNIPDELVVGCLVTYDMTDIIGYASTSCEDHPAFAKVRKILSATGYIEIPSYPCVNGDRVLKRFKFNGFQLEPGEKFVCASAWDNIIKLRNRKQNEKMGRT